MWHSGLEIVTREETRAEAKATVPSASHWFDGHFPGMPLLPGIAQLSMVEAVIKSAFLPTLRADQFSRVRFKLKIDPDMPVSIAVSRNTEKPDVFSFQIATPEGIACVGNVHTRDTKAA